MVLNWEKKRRFTLAFLLVFFTSALFSFEVPPLTGRVVDKAGVIESEDIVQLDSLLKSVEEKTESQIVVLTIPSLQGEEISTYAYKVAETWGLGQEGKDNGVLLLVAMAEREVRIEVGYGLEGILNDAKCGRIIRNVIIPEFKNENYSSGIMAGVQNICGFITEDLDLISDSVEKEKNPEDKNLAFVIMFIIFICMIIFSHLFGGGSYSYGRGFANTGGTRTNFGGMNNFGGNSFGGFSGGGGHFGGGGASGKW